MSKYLDSYTKPVLKWAGGKTQMLGEIVPRMPKQFNRYIEPFLGSGALFFALAPEKAIIADSNAELINLYQVLTSNVEELISLLATYRNEKDEFYRVRALEIGGLSPLEAAARTVYLNKTCFNGLYRVNKKGQFNTPYGRNKRTVFCNENEIRKAAQLLSKSEIMCADYHEVMMEHVSKGDFVFLDPPYVPISKYSDFKRYTKDQFGEEDQRKLARDVHILHERGCSVMLTNSNHPLVHELYSDFKIEIFETKRMINKDGNKRTGEDVIVTTY